MNPVSRSLITIEQVVWGEYTRAMPLAIPLRSMVVTTSSVTSTNSMQREVVKVWFSNSIFMCPTRLRRGEGPLAVQTEQLEPSATRYDYPVALLGHRGFLSGWPMDVKERVDRRRCEGPRAAERERRGSPLSG